jgi:hypothetical protein
MDNTDKILERGAQVFRERRPIYGRNAPKIGRALQAMFPEGLTLTTAEDFTRFYLFQMQLVKQSRYANNFLKGGHADSMVDTCVYAAMLQATDEEPT